jgi:xylulokinase
MNFLGIDIGTGGSRAVIIDEKGAVISAASADHENFAVPHPGWAESSHDDWWRAACEATREAVDNANISPESIGAVGLSGQMHGAVLLDESDTPLRPAILWCDQRTQRQCDEITAKVGPTRLVELVSNPAITGFTLPKLLWVRENEPDVWRKTRTVLLPKDHVRLRLTGDKASDVADASGTLMFAVAKREWSQAMLDEFEIDRGLLPEVFESIEVTGRISSSAATATGLAEGTPVVAGAGDNAAGAIGMGIAVPGMVSVTIGTSGVVFGVSNRPAVDPRGRIHTLCHAIPVTWHNTGVTLAAGLSLKWLRDNMLGGASYDDLMAEAVTVAPGSGGLIWLPYLMGERSPHLDPDARAAFVGLTAAHTRAHLIRAVLEGVAFSLRESIEIFAENGLTSNSMRLGGGGAKSRLWCQMQADVYGKPVERLEAEEGSAFGAAILAGVGAGAWKSVASACESAVRTSEVIEPDRSATEALERNYESYRALYPSLREME